MNTILQVGKRYLLMAVIFFSFAISMQAQVAYWNYDLTGQTKSLPDTTGSARTEFFGSFDSGKSLVELPFAFDFYNVSYAVGDSIYVSTNGAIRLDDVISHYSNGLAIPTSSSSYGQMIQYGGIGDARFLDSVRTKVIGTTPNREFVIVIPYQTYWSTSTSSYQAGVFVSLFETTNEVKIQYNNVVTATSYQSTHVGINAGDGVYGTSTGVFPAVDTAYSFTFPVLNALDASVDAIYMNSTIQGTHNVDARLLNMGTTTLTGATLNWTINGVTQTPFVFTGSISQFDKDTVTIGSYNFNIAGDFDIVVWSSAPNAGTDANTNNDSSDVSVSIQEALDAGVTNVFVSGTSSGNQTIEAEIKNYGTTALTATAINWSVGGVAQTAVNFTGSLAQNDVDTITLGVFNFATVGAIAIEASTVLTNDEDNNNDTFAIVHNTYSAISLPYTEGFENQTASDFNITLGANALATVDNVSPSQGSYAAHLYTDANSTFTGSSSASATAYTWTNTHKRVNAQLMVDGTSQTNIELKFDLRQTYSYGKGYSNFRLVVNGTPIASNAGITTYQPTTKIGDAFATVIYDLTAYAGTNFTVDFQTECKYLSSNGGADAAFIDQVRLMAPIQNDAGIENAFIASNQVGVQTIESEIKNWGAVNLTAVTINWSVDGAAQTPFSYTGNLVQYDTDTIDIGSFNFTQGTHAIKVWVSSPNAAVDGDNLNDTLLFTHTFYGNVTVPYLENFETQNASDFNITLGVNALATVDTISPSLGSYAAHLYADANSAFTGSSSTSAAAYTWTNTHKRVNAQLMVDGTSQTAIELKFDLRQTYSYGKGYSNFRIVVNGTPIASKDGITTYQPTTKISDAFATVAYDLSAYAGTSFTIDFQTECKYLSVSGGADAAFIDQVKIMVPLANDISVKGLILPVSNACGNATSIVEAIVKNEGTADQINIPIKLYISGAASDTVSVVIPSLISGVTDTIAFPAFNTISTGAYNLEAQTLLSTDGDLMNDSILGSFEFYPSIPAPYIQNFEGSYTEWDLSGFALSSTHGLGSNAISENMFSASSSNPIAKQVRKISNITSNSMLSFDYRFVLFSTGNPALTLNDDSLIVKVSTDCGTTYTSIAVIDTNNHIPSAQMVRKEVSLAAYAGQDIMIKIEGLWDTQDYWLDIDNIAIGEPITVDLGADIAICDYDSTTLMSGIAGQSQYTWKNLLGIVISTSQDITVDTAGTFILEVQSLAGYTDIDTVVVTVNAPTPSSFTGLAATYCETESVVALTPTPAGGVFTGAGITGTDFDPATAGSGSHIITYTYTDNNTCVSVATNSVAIVSTVVIVPMDDQEICEGESVQLNLDLAHSDMIFSKYIEGSGNNKAIELYNGTMDTIELANYRIAQSSNGNGWNYNHIFPAGAKLAPKSVWVIANSGIAAAIYDTTLANEVLGYPSVVHHNGDDARGIEKTTDGGTTWTLIDIIGTPNVDPGSAWEVAGVANATANHTLVRKSSVLSPDTNWAAVAGTDSLNSQYTVYPTNDFTNVGSFGGAVVIPGFTYTWNNGTTGISLNATPVVDTQYVVTVNNTCVSTDTVDVTVHALPVVALTAPDTICVTDELTLDAGAGFASYMWSDNSTAQTLLIASNSLTAGTYKYGVTVNNAFGCENSDSISIVVDNCTGINDAEMLQNLVIYPNPTNGILNVEFNNTLANVRVNMINANGQVLMVQDLDNINFTQLDLSGFAKGVYFLQIISDKNIVIKKVIVD